MSGITPLLDTLLHQVLGKRVDTPPARDLNQPVTPTSPADAPKALHSDSRLDARANQPPLPELGRASRDLPDTATRPLPSQGQPPPSAQTHFSSSARTIADLLVRFPAPPSIVTTLRPLMVAGQTPDPSVVASRLEDSIRHSGLFYESHLARWYKGEVSRHQLDREPQMWRTLNFSPSSTPHGGIPSGSLANARDTPFLAASPFAPGSRAARPSRMADVQTTPSTSPTSTTPSATPSAQVASLPGSQTAAGPDTGSPANLREPFTEATLRSQASHPVQESLQGIVRHQLEMLVTPVLRWEGDIWSGLFMTLMIQLPSEHRDPSGSRDTDQQRTNAEQQDWRSEIDLDIAGLGRLKASLWMKANSVEIDLQVAHDASRQELEKGLDSLRSRLAGHGFEEIKVHLNRLEEAQIS